ncbi:MAG: ornithine cyclodeaminase family protein [Thermoproteus sp.]
MFLLRDVDSLVDAAGLVEDIMAALRAPKKVLPRRALEHQGLWFAPMAAYVEGMGIGAKLVGIYPKARPPVKAISALIDVESGEVLAVADGTKLTGWRTAAASALAVRLLGARPDVVGVIGAGVQAEYHVRVFREVFRPSRILVYSKSRAADFARRLGVEAAALEEVHRADLVIAATNSREPVVSGRLLRPGAVVVSVGAPKPVRELDEETKRRARCAVADSPEAREETDDLSGLDVVLLEDLASSRGECRRGELALYKSVGYAPFDTAAVFHVYRRALQMGKGLKVDF